MKLCTFEKNVILSAAGLPQIGDPKDHVTGWGSALGAAIEPLKRAGYLRQTFDGVTIQYAPTEAGIAAAQEDEGESPTAPSDHINDR